MDLQTSLNNLHEEVSCSVCMCTFTDPKMLPCLHTFCLHCLNKIQRTSGIHGEIICPECRRKFQVPGSGNPSELPTNFRMNSLLDVLAIRECNSAGVECGNCEKTSAQSFYCFNCSAFWCEVCVSAHTIIKANKNHRVLAIKDFRDEDIEDVLKRPAFCQKKHHENEELKFFCKNCEVAICNTCVVTLHEGHVKILLQDAANEKKLRLESVIESQKEEALQQKNTITKLQNDRVKIQAQVANVNRSAQSFVDNVIKIIEAKKQEICKEVEDKAKESLERLGIRQNGVENELHRIETSIEKTETFLKQSTIAEIVQLGTMFQDRISDEAQQIDSDLEDLGHFIFVGSETLMDKASSEGVGFLKKFLSKTKASQSSAQGQGICEATVGFEAQFVLTTRNAEDAQGYEEFNFVTVEIRNDQSHDCTTEAQVQDNKDGSYNISYFAKESGTCYASVMVNGEHVCGSPYTVQVKPRQFRPVLSFGQEGSSAGMFNHPWGVAVNEHNEIAVTDTDNCRVQVFSSDGTHLRSFGRKGDQEGEFSLPTGIAFLNNGNIIVADSWNSRVQMFTEKGEYLSQFGGKGNLDHQFKYPWGVSVDSDGNIVVADSNHKLIKIFSPNGQFLRKFGGEDCLVAPCHCIQREKYLIVSDCGEHCIKVFNTEGNFLYKFGIKGEGNGKFDSPRYLSVDKAGHLITCEYMNDRVQVFEMSGKFIKKFGSNGEEIGELDGPTSTAVLTDGRIVVSDRCNHRIQIFE